PGASRAPVAAQRPPASRATQSTPLALGSPGSRLLHGVLSELFVSAAIASPRRIPSTRRDTAPARQSRHRAEPPARQSRHRAEHTVAAGPTPGSRLLDRVLSEICTFAAIAPARRAPSA